MKKLKMGQAQPGKTNKSLGLGGWGGVFLHGFSRNEDHKQEYQGLAPLV